MELTSRDLIILRLVFKFKFCLGRHVLALAGFNGLRSTDRKLKALIDVGYLSRKKYIYGVPYIYTLTHKGRMLLGVNKREDKIRIEHISHDIYVLETVVFYVSKYGLFLEDITSAKELHIKDGFGKRKHQPDFAVNIGGKNIAVEIELNPKVKERLEKNIRDNYLSFDKQVWITNDNKVFSLIQNFNAEYSNIEIIRLEEVLEYVNKRYR